MRPFRRRPPDPGRTALLRQRLLSALLGRFERRLVTVVAPAGFGKTTLLAQAVGENALLPRGIDVWLSCEPADAAGTSLLSGLAAGLGTPGDRRAATNGSNDLDRVVAAVWSRSPLPVALVLDDVHEIPAGSDGAALLDELVVALPENGHLVLAGRTEPPVRTGRLLAEDRVLLLHADDLLLTPAERAELADLLSVDVAVLDDCGGWPALARLTAVAGQAGAERYVWEEVLHSLRPEARHVLATLSAIGGADDGLASVVLERPVALDELLGDVPLVAQRQVAEHGRWYVPHDLWQPFLAADIGPDVAATARRRAARALRERGDLRRAGELLLSDPVDDAGWAELEALLVDGAAAASSLTGTVPVGAWLSAVPPERRDAAEVLLIEAVVARLRGHSVPAQAGFRRAWDAARAQAAGEVELVAMSHLVHQAWWQGDLGLFAELFARVEELGAAGDSRVWAFKALGSALLTETTGDPAAALAQLDEVPTLPAGLVAVRDWLRVRCLLALGRGDEAFAIADPAAGPPDALPAIQMQPLTSLWLAARPRDLMGRIQRVVPGADTLPRDRLLANLSLSAYAASLGRAEEAEVRLEEARRHLGAIEGDRPARLLAAVAATGAVCRGDEAAARQEVARLPDDPATRLLFRMLLPLLAVADPRWRAGLAAESLGPDHATNREVAQALIAARAGRPSAGGPWPPPRVLVAVGYRLATELAARTGDDELLRYLLTVVGPPVREALRALAPAVPGARRMLRSVPSPPDHALHIRVLGPPSVEHDGIAAGRPEWGRERVRSLLCWLVARRRVTRAETEAALWPEFDALTSGGNLRTTLGYLQRVVEPARAAGDAPFHVRADGDALLLADEAVTVDAWEFERLLDEAADAEAAGAPSVALVAYESAVALWGGDYLVDVYDDWAGPERDRLRARFLAGSVRAGELQLAAGDVDRALLLATRAIEAEPWSEPAHRLAIAAHLARGDRASARRALDRCHRALDDLGVGPDELTVMLERAVLG
ncbi:MAG TPA: BTAD domain-containing putative transcriptional regulator [Acidimicrobiales bacterium]|nr:BTAD domain-containing putative transcriptional regulator [Acidimicrobiales bacterium]